MVDWYKINSTKIYFPVEHLINICQSQSTKSCVFVEQLKKTTSASRPSGSLLDSIVER